MYNSAKVNTFLRHTWFFEHNGRRKHEKGLSESYTSAPMPSPARTAEYHAFLIRLRTARKRAHLTQSEVALRLNKPQSYVSKCESGDRRIDATEVIAFADLYGVSIEEPCLGSGLSATALP
jgi:ribosome-binding protein aMBF1 (putative translation factor)